MEKILVDFRFGNTMEIVLKDKILHGLAVRTAEFDHDEPDGIGRKAAFGAAPPFIAQCSPVNTKFRITAERTIRRLRASVVESEFDPKRTGLLTFELLAEQSGNRMESEATSEKGTDFLRFSSCLPSVHFSVFVINFRILGSQCLQCVRRQIDFTRSLGKPQRQGRGRLHHFRQRK